MSMLTSRLDKNKVLLWAGGTRNTSGQGLEVGAEYMEDGQRFKIKLGLFDQVEYFQTTQLACSLPVV